MSKGDLKSGQDPTKAIKDRPEVGPTSEDILKEKSKGTGFKIASVIVYVMAVTGNGFLLSVFFLFIWNPQIDATRPSNMAEDRGLFGRWAPAYGYLRADSLKAVEGDGIVAQARKAPQPPAVPYHRIMSTEFTNNYLHGVYENIVPGSKHVIPEAPSVLSSQEQEEYEHNGSTAADHDGNSPQHHDETNMHVSSLGSEYSESTSTSNGGPSTTSAMQQQAIPVSQS